MPSYGSPQANALWPTDQWPPICWIIWPTIIIFDHNPPIMSPVDIQHERPGEAGFGGPEDDGGRGLWSGRRRCGPCIIPAHHRALCMVLNEHPRWFPPPISVFVLSLTLKYIHPFLYSCPVLCESVYVYVYVYVCACVHPPTCKLSKHWQRGLMCGF